MALQLESWPTTLMLRPSPDAFAVAALCERPRYEGRAVAGGLFQSVPVEHDGEGGLARFEPPQPGALSPIMTKATALRAIERRSPFALTRT